MDMVDTSKVWPSGSLHDKHRGELVAGRWLFGFIGCKGDLEWRRDAMNEKRNYGANNLCPKCCASKKCIDVLFTDMSAIAGWLKTLIKDVHYRLNNAETLSPLMSIPGMHCDGFCWDFMHNMFIGPGADAAASALVLLIQIGWWANNVEEALEKASDDFAAWCRAHEIDPPGKSFSRNNLGWRSNNEFPCLGWKAAEVKLVISWVASILPDAGITGSVEVQMAGACLWGAADLIFVLDHAGMFLSTYEIDRATKAGWTFLRSYVCLVDYTIKHHLVRWNLRPKLHYLAHQVLDLQTGLNPFFFSCFNDEDYMGRMSHLAAAVHARVVGDRSMSRYLILIQRRWLSHRQRLQSHGWKPVLPTIFKRSRRKPS